MITINYYYTSDTRWFNDLCNSFQKINPDVWIENNSLHLNPSIGKGKIDFIEVVEGLGVLCVDYTFTEDINWVHQPSALNDYFMINFNIGDEVFKIKNAEGTEINSGESLSKSIFYSSSGVGFECYIPRKKRVKFVQLIISNKWILNKIQYYKLPVIADFHDYASNNSFQEIFNMNLDCKEIATNILGTDFSNPVAKLKIKGDILELIACFYRKVNDAMVREKRTKADDIEKIKTEIRILEEQFGGQWPTLAALVKKCDMSRTKFTNLFNQIYGRSYMVVCLETKMKQACKMIVDNISVSEAGWQIGYTSLGHFSKMFKKITGLLPSQVPKENCLLECPSCPYKSR